MSSARTVTSIVADHRGRSKAISSKKDSPVKTLDRLAQRWARYVSKDRSALKEGLFGLAFGALLLGVYLFRAPEHPYMLGVSVFVLTLAVKRFERAGFIGLLEQSKDRHRHPGPG
jgi:hypothetical protein